MIELYLIVTFAANAPKIETFPTEQAACVALEGKDASLTPHIYKEAISRRDEATISEGECKPLQQFVTHK